MTGQAFSTICAGASPILFGDAHSFSPFLRKVIVAQTCCPFHGRFRRVLSFPEAWREHHKDFTMKILWVKAGGLVPPDTGGKIRSYNILLHLGRQHSVTLFSFHAATENDQHDQLRSLFHGVVCIPLALPQPRSAIELVDYCRSFFSPDPYNITKYCRPHVLQGLHNLLKGEAYDVIVCDFLTAAAVMPRANPIPTVLFTHNVEAMIWQRHFETARNPLWKAISRHEWRRMQAAERRYLERADHVLTVSEDDRRAFSAYLDPSRLTVVPTGVDVEYFQPAAEPETPNRMVFTGSMDWLPNQDGILYFIKEILPLIRKEIPEVQIWVAGRSPSPALRAAAAREPNIHLTGRVDDIRPFLARSSVVFVPLRIGGGTRLKIFEAMSMAKPVVSTTIGAEGLPVLNEQHLLLADDPVAFAQSCLRLLRDTGLRRQIGLAGRALVQQKYSWAQVASVFNQALLAAVEKRTSRNVVHSETR